MVGKLFVNHNRKLGVQIVVVVVKKVGGVGIVVAIHFDRENLDTIAANASGGQNGVFLHSLLQALGLHLGSLGLGWRGLEGQHVTHNNSGNVLHLRVQLETRDGHVPGHVLTAIEIATVFVGRVVIVVVDLMLSVVGHKERAVAGKKHVQSQLARLHVLGRSGLLKQTGRDRDTSRFRLD